MLHEATKLGRFELMGIVLLVHSVVLLFANLWLARYRQGPIEALWSRLSY